MHLNNVYESQKYTRIFWPLFSLHPPSLQPHTSFSSILFSTSPSSYVFPPALSMCSAKCPDVPSEWFHRQDFLKTQDAATLLQKKKEEFLLIKNQRRLGQESWEAYEGYLKGRKHCIMCTHKHTDVRTNCSQNDDPPQHI